MDLVLCPLISMATRSGTPASHEDSGPMPQRVSPKDFRTHRQETVFPARGVVHRPQKDRKPVLADRTGAGLHPRARASAHPSATRVRSTLRLLRGPGQEQPWEIFKSRYRGVRHPQTACVAARNLQRTVCYLNCCSIDAAPLNTQQLTQRDTTLCC